MRDVLAAGLDQIRLWTGRNRGALNPAFESVVPVQERSKSFKGCRHNTDSAHHLPPPFLHIAL